MHQPESADDAAWRAQQRLRFASLDDTAPTVGHWVRVRAFIAILVGGILATLVASLGVAIATIVSTTLAATILISLIR